MKISKQTEMDVGTYHFTGGSIVTRADFEGAVLHFRSKQSNPETTLDLVIPKRDAARMSQLIETGRKYWKRFRLPKMYEQHFVWRVRENERI